MFDIDWFLTPEFQRVFDYVFASPDTIEAVRMFGVLNSGTNETATPGGSGTVWPLPIWPVDFSTTFDALEALTSHGLTPYIVLSFFPAAVSDNPTTLPTSFTNWQRLVQQFFTELSADPRFSESISEWWFDVWNEPNVTTFWKDDFEAYLDLYRATSQAVTDAGVIDIQLSGPTIAYFPHKHPNAGAPLMERFLRFLSDEPEVKCDFISFHGKGSTGDTEPNLRRIVNAAKEIADMALFIDQERFNGISIINNESDMRLGFNTPYEPRMTEQFPAWLSAVSIAYDALSQQYSANNIRFLAASDNANQQLIQESFGGRRSILTRTSRSPTDLFKIPAYNYYELLRLLGNRHGTFVRGSEYYFPKTDLFHALTSADTHLGLLFTVYPDVITHQPSSWEIEYTLTDIPWQTVNLAQFQIDRYHSNAYTAAGRSLSHPSPTPAEARRIRKLQELSVSRPIQRGVELTAGRLDATLTLDPFTTVLYWITPVIPDTPATPAWIETTVENENVIVQWEPNREPFFYSYEVYAVEDGKPAKRLTPVPLRAAIWVDTVPPSRFRRYGIRAVSASGIKSEMITTDLVSV
ncbi:GH39 family glycosyl hydrolase [Haladaptatus halobius]|uniref:GH39 family glycosyl hydrolase n=1 Tax=Haladaptatus halobius TaxID=2884875 RepID=UPI001D0A577E|nr:hypothetical protein [Haladaptatus halobius]